MGNGITKEDIDRFLSGTDPMEHIIKIEGSYDDDKMTIIFRGKNNKLKILNTPIIIPIKKTPIKNI